MICLFSPFIDGQVLECSLKKPYLHFFLDEPILVKEKKINFYKLKNERNSLWQL